MVSLEELVPANHIYRKFKELRDFTAIKKEIDKMESNANYKGFRAFRLFLFYGSYCSQFQKINNSSRPLFSSKNSLKHGIVALKLQKKPKN